jgi:hypothetical protein
MSSFTGKEAAQENKSESAALRNLKLLIADTLEKGASIKDEIEFREEASSGVGVFASTPFPKGTTLISIPYSLCLTLASVKEYPKLSYIFVDNPGLLQYPDEVLAIGLMYALMNEDADCPWKNHVKTLPKTFNTTLFWSDEEMNELKGHNVYHLTNMLNQRISSDFESIHQPLMENYPEILSNIDLDTYAWALSVVYSRSLDITRDGQNERVIVPVLDMLNHSPFVAGSASETFQYDEKTETINYSCSIDLQAGDQCFAVYGHYPNAKLLFTYGFVVPHNPVKAIDLWTRVTPSTSNSEMKAKLLQENQLTRVQTYDFTGTIGPHYVSNRLLATIRVIQAESDEIPMIDNAFRGKMISVRNELASYTSLKNLIKLRLKPEIAEVICSEILGISLSFY